MKEQKVILKSYRKEIEVLVLTMNIPVYEDERSKYLAKYEDVLLRLFNNKRENKDILRLDNYAGSNEITITINLTSYLEDSYKDRDECIKHLKEWFSSGVDTADDDIETEIAKAYIYTIPEYENNIKSFDGDTYIRNYVEWED